jgi:hypothetical protein
MQSIKRDLSVGLCVTTLLFVGALAWGSPFVSASADSGAAAAQAPQTQPQPSQAQPDQAQPDQAQPQQSKSTVFTGTVVKRGSAFALRDSSGQVFKLDNPETAKPYEGKSVKITGQLDEQAKLIRVESIESTDA